MSLPGQFRSAARAGGVIFLLLLFAFTAWAFLKPAYSRDALLAGFIRFGDLRAAGVREDELPEIAEGIAGFLRGDSVSPQVEVTRYGAKQEVFSQRELDHLPDVKHMTDWGRLLWWFGLGVLTLLAVIAIRAMIVRDVALPSLLGKSLLGAATVFLAFMAGIAIWAASDFTGLFYQMHLWLFTNDLWQMNPAEHMMIQLMPEAFFRDYALSSLKRMAWLLLAFPIAVGLLSASHRRAR